MDKERYINISIPIEAHRLLKTLAKGKQMSMASYVLAMVQFFSRSGRDPEDLAPINFEAELFRLKKRQEQLARILKGQEKKVLNPMAEAVFGMERSLIGALSGTKLLMLLQADLCCPRCQAAFVNFEQRAQSFRCTSCGLELGMSIGQYDLGLADLATLLSGGMTRVLENVELPHVGTKTGRYLLHPSYNFELQLFEHS